MDYSKAFRIVRAAFGLNQAELSALLEIDPSHMSLIEAGKRQPSQKVILKLEETLNVPASLVTLLASDSQDLEKQGPLEEVALSLLKLLVEASERNVER